MPEPCSIRGGVVTGDSAHCPECAGLLRWVRGYFANVPGLAAQIIPETTFLDLGADCLDWMDWLFEAKNKPGITSLPMASMGWPKIGP
jgi:hypothetical protein